MKDSWSAKAQTRRVFELRTYTAAGGKLPRLLARFRDHTMSIFEKHGMSNVGYWVPQDTPGSENTLIYIISHNSREAADANWSAFDEDPEWQRVEKASQVDGLLITNIESVFMESTDFSPIK
ncbi:MAG: NIPSNAP family protein [Candidatus Latescibacteria bacterium]|nr:NIPSNAP family protein [Candidatus Latescibacterota bacterium]